MKGMLDIEFIVSVFVFMIAVSFVLLTLTGSLPKMHQETLSQDIQSKAFQVSEMLVGNEGWPYDWNSNVASATRVGLTNGTKYRIDSQKIQALASLCAADYSRAKALMGIDFHNDVAINMDAIDSPSSFECMPGATSTVRSSASVTRLAVDELGRIWMLKVTIL